MKIDIASETWALIRHKCTERIDACTNQIVSLMCSEKDADQARGEIAAYRAILALGDQLKVQPSDYSKRTDRSGI